MKVLVPAIRRIIVQYDFDDISSIITRMANGMTVNHRERKLQEKIRQHIIKSYQQTLAHKQRAVANCETVLSKKLYGES